MKNNRLLFLVVLLLSATAISSCNSANSNKSPDAQVPDQHTAQTSLDWQGTYSGNLPCADCERIEMELTLNDDQSYRLISRHVKGSQTVSDTLQGKFQWQGNKVHLEGIPDNERSSQFKIEEDQVRYLDMEGNPVTGSLAQNYVLTKNGNKEVEDKRWQLAELEGKPVNGSPNKHFIIFHSKEGRAEAKANCNTISLPYTIKNKLQLRFRQGLTTLMACPDSLEQEFLRVLSVVDNLSSDGKTLSLNRARMAPLARFELVE